jgi:superfamily II DNA helicase RecQ
VIQYGVTQDLCSLIQRAGRVGRDFTQDALFLIMWEPWVHDITIPDSQNGDSDPDRPSAPLSKEKDPTKPERTGLAMIQLIQDSARCIRKRLWQYLGDDGNSRQFPLTGMGY